MNTTATSALNSTRPDASRTNSSSYLGLAILAAALISATSCSSDTTTNATTTATTTTTTTVAAATSTSDVPTATTAATSTSTTSPVPTTTGATAVPRPTATIDQLVGAAGSRVHVRCVGHGDTTVLLIAGFGGDTSGWVKVEPAIATQARVCSYDRLGTGTSDAATSAATFNTQAADLHALLSTIGEPGPYVVVGHSFGGAEAVTFASHFSDEVTGLALIDAPPTTWPAALCAVADDGTDGAAFLRQTCSVAFLPTGNSEHLDVEAAFAEVSDIVSLGSLPMAVVTATTRTLPADLAATEAARLTDVWNQGQQDWLALSTVPHLVSVDQTGHHIEIDQPGVVIDEIARLLP